jgi:hypothetical protein
MKDRRKKVLLNENGGSSFSFAPLPCLRIKEVLEIL